METLNIIAQTAHNETIFKEFRFDDGELKTMTSFPHITFRRYIVQVAVTYVNKDATISLL